ncbi:MAG: ribulokinase [Verrucomicrobiales bacterium]|nr:ribulokinase [Verrucomicrobiales bacterium]
MIPRYAIGLDYGTNSCRALLVDLCSGYEIATHVFPYPSGEMGILLDERDPHVARQNPRDYLDGLTATITAVLEQAKRLDRKFDPTHVIGIGIDTTGSTPMPVDASGTPLGLLEEFQQNLNAQAWLWKDHTAHAEAEEITSLAQKMHPEYLAKCGGVYSSEWWWSKLLRLRRAAPDVFKAAHSFVEHCDWIPAVLSGQSDPQKMARSICAAGHKAMFHPQWGGLPARDFLTRLDPDLAALRDRLYARALTSDQLAGRLSPNWAKKLGLRAGIAVAVGAFDAHMGAVGAGIKEGTLVKILGTSTCDLMVVPNQHPLGDVPGLCGIVDGSVMPGYFGLEAGQSAVGDIFLWFVRHLVPEHYGHAVEEKFASMERALAPLKPGATGLLALDWNNGNRTVLVDARLSGLLLGQSLHTEAHEIYRALIESTAFGALTIINRLEEHGVKVSEVISTGGLAVKNATLMQIYADVLGRPMMVSRSDQTCALGAAIFGAVAAGREVSGFGDVEAAQKMLCGVRDTVYRPNADAHRVYRELFSLYRTLHDGFGTREWTGNLHAVMKDLLRIRDAQRSGFAC